MIGHHDDTDRPHSHIALKIEYIHGERINPRREELQQYREGFAEALREQGVEANATSRVSRLSTRQRVQQSRYQYQVKHSTPEQLDAILNPAFENLPHQQTAINEFAAIYQQLKAGSQDDRVLAGRLNEYVMHQTSGATLEQSRAPHNQQDIGLEL